MRYYVNVWLIKRTEPNGKVYVDYQNAYASKRMAESIAAMLADKKVFPGRETSVLSAKLSWEDAGTER